MKGKKILIVDDDLEILELIKKLLEQHHFTVITASGGSSLLKCLDQHDDIELIVLDVMLEDADGISLCKEIRKRSTVPIILLTSNQSESDRVIGLEFGADDYMHKPFNPRELVARIQTILRRTSVNQSVQNKDSALITYLFGGWKLDTSTRELISPDNVEKPITTAEYNLLLIFLQKPKRVLSRNLLLEVTKNTNYEVFD